MSRRQNLAYRFKPEIKGLDLDSVCNIAVLGFLGYFGVKFFFKSGVLSKSSTAKTEGSGLSGAIKKTDLPKGVDTLKLEDRLNRLENKLYTLFIVDNKGIYELLEDLSSKELDWIYLKWGVRVYQHGFLDEKESLGLFGWFDKQLSNKYMTKMKVLWSKSTFKYYPA